MRRFTKLATVIRAHVRAGTDTSIVLKQIAVRFGKPMHEVRAIQAAISRKEAANDASYPDTSSQVTRYKYRPTLADDPRATAYVGRGIEFGSVEDMNAFLAGDHSVPHRWVEPRERMTTPGPHPNAVTVEAVDWNAETGVAILTLKGPARRFTGKP